MSNQIYYVEGIWKIFFTKDRAKSTFCTLTQTGNTFTGVFRGPLGNLPIEGALNNKGNIAFTAESILGNFNFFGMLNEENMYGTVYFPRGECQESWTAIKIVDE